MIRKNEKMAATEMINAFNTGRSYASSSKKPDGSKFNLNAKIIDGPTNLRMSRMRLDSGASNGHDNIPKRVGNV